MVINDIVLILGALTALLGAIVASWKGGGKLIASLMDSASSQLEIYREDMAELKGRLDAAEKKINHLEHQLQLKDVEMRQKDAEIAQLQYNEVTLSGKLTELETTLDDKDKVINSLIRRLHNAGD